MPSIGRIVHYKLSAEDAEAINRRHQHARAAMKQHIDNANGVQVHAGNDVKADESYPMVITRVWGSTPADSVNDESPHPTSVSKEASRDRN